MLRPSARRPRSMFVIAIAIALAALIAPPPAQTAPAAVRVAVADFQPAGSVGEYESLGAGLQSMLTTDLAAADQITVVERARLQDLRKELKLGRSAWADPNTALKVGKLAGATHLVTGTFTLVGNRLRIDARVVDVATGRVAHAADAAGERDAFFELEKKVAGAIVAGLGVALTPKERATFARIQTSDWEAFRRFGDGLRLFDDAEYDKSIEALRQATARDQEFKLAQTTLENYQRLASEIRSRATVIEAERAASAAEVRKQMRAEEQALVERLTALASARTGQSPAARAERAAALYLVTRVLADSRNQEGLDMFARGRLLDGYVARYVREADKLFPDMPIVPFAPMGERFGGPEVPKTPADVQKAVDGARDRFARYGLDPRKEGDEIRRYKEEHLQSLFRKEAERTASHLHLDARGAADLTDRFYAAAARFSTTPRWRSEALRVRALQRRRLLDIDASTRLFKEAATIETSPDTLRTLAREVETNGQIAAVLRSGSADPCLTEWTRAALDSFVGNIERRFTQDSKEGSLCASGAVGFARRRLGKWLLFGDVPTWLFGPRERALSTGPRSGPDRAVELRYFARKQDREGWALAVLGGSPRATGTVGFELSYALPADLPLTELCGGRRTDCLASGERPRVTVFFDATNVEVWGRRPTPRDLREDVPMLATGVSLDAQGARRVDLRVLARSEQSRNEGVSATERARQPLDLPGTGKVQVTVRREDRRLVVDAGGRQVAFDAPPGGGGFVGLLVEGTGFVRIAAPSVR